MKVSISKDKKTLDVEYIYKILSQSYWVKDRSKEQVIKSIEHSVCYGMYHDESQIGFARVVTDYVVFAYVMDVFIDSKYQRRGLGQYLMKYILEDPAMVAVGQWHLKTKDAHRMYAKLGFTELSNPEISMELIK